VHDLDSALAVLTSDPDVEAVYLFGSQAMVGLGPTRTWISRFFFRHA
jgi:hypothetical protein